MLKSMINPDLSGKKLLIVIMILFVSYLVFAEQTEGKIGIGAGFGKEVMVINMSNNPAWTMDDFPSIYVSYLNKNIKVDAEFGYYYYHDETDENEDDEKRENTQSILKLGLGAFYKKNYNKFMNYFGGRFAFYDKSSESIWYYPEYTQKEKQSITDYEISPTIGSEYFFSEKFSIGGEIQLNYKIYGKIEDDEGGDESANSFLVKPVFTIKWYF